MQMQEKRYRKIMLVSLAATLSLVVVLPLFMSQYGRLFDFIKAIPIVGLIVSYNFPPSDYYVPCLNAPLDSHAESIPFICRYAGRYEVDVRGFTGTSLEESNFGLCINVRNVRGEIVYSGVQSNAVAFASYDHLTNEEYFRFCYFILNLPEDFSLGMPVSFSYECFGQYDSFVDANPQARIVIQKFTDK